MVFDMTGATACDTGIVTDFLCATLRAAGAPVTRDAVRAVIGMPQIEAIRMLLARVDPRAASPERVAAISEAFENRLMDHCAASGEQYEADGAAAVFHALHSRGVAVALDTALSRRIADAVLNRLGWRDDGLVDATVTSDEVSRGRPHPDMILTAMERLGVRDPRYVGKVGDTPSDLDEGWAAGCGMVVGLANTPHALSDLSAHRHTHLIASLRELPALLDAESIPPPVARAI